MSDERRVLVTGARKWTDRQAVWDVLDLELEWTRQLGCRLTVVHGKSPGGGVDLYAEEWVDDQRAKGAQDVDQDPYPPDYESYGRGAPFVRNTEMAKSALDRCHAFPMEGTGGTRHQMSQVYRHNPGVQVVNHGYQPYTIEAQQMAGISR